VIYSIPRSSPLYYVTYVRVYDATPEVVYVGYTPGYVGSYVSSDNVVVYGTGWPYRPWIGSVWYGAPVTWGFGFSFFYTWWQPYPWYSWHRVAWAPPPPCFRPWWGPWHAPVYGHRFVAGGANAFRPTGPRMHNVGRIYDRWDRRSVVWNGPRAIANQHRPGAPTFSHPAPGHGFVAGSDGRWRRLGDDGNRDHGRRDAQVRGNAANSPGMPSPRGVDSSPAARTPPAAQTPWRRPPVANREDGGRAQRPSFGGNDRGRADRQFPQRERVLDQRQTNETVPRPRMGDRPIMDRSRGQQDRPVQAQPPQRIPPVAGVPIERAPSQPQRVIPLGRSISPPQGRIERPAINTGRIERPAMSNPGRIERPAAANPGHGMERPSMNSGRFVERSADRPQSRSNDWRGNSNSGGGGFRAGERNR